jgi:hypothetical protein
LAERFFFYDNGMKDAIELILRSYVHTVDPQEDHTGSPYDQILTDLDRYLNLAHETNSVPNQAGFDDMYFVTQMACEFLDAHVFHVVCKFFGNLEFKIVGVQDLFPYASNRYEYLITVNFT